MAGPDGNHYESYQNESETTALLSPSPPSSPRRSKDHGSSPAVAQEDVRKHYKYALGTGYMFAMGVCGIVLVALGSTLDDLAANADSTATDVRERNWLLSFKEMTTFVLVGFGCCVLRRSESFLADGVCSRRRDRCPGKEFMASVRRWVVKNAPS